MPAQQITRTGSFTLSCSTDRAFPLFSPEGERLWIKTWNPQPIYPDTIEFRRDTVFREGDEFQESLWSILDADPHAHRAEYVRHAPNSHAAHIIVKIDPASPGCQVTVTYTLTVFGPNADELLAKFSDSAYAERMRNWQRQLTEYLANAH
jgi:hypothetical protein